MGRSGRDRACGQILDQREKLQTHGDEYSADYRVVPAEALNDHLAVRLPELEQQHEQVVDPEPHHLDPDDLEAGGR